MSAMVVYYYLQKSFVAVTEKDFNRLPNYFCEYFRFVSICVPEFLPVLQYISQVNCLVGTMVLSF